MSKKKYKEGDRSRAVCEKCGLVSTTFKLIDGILYAFCDCCNEKVSIVNVKKNKIKATYWWFFYFRKCLCFI